MWARTLVWEILSIGQLNVVLWPNTGLDTYTVSPGSQVQAQFETLFFPALP